MATFLKSVLSGKFLAVRQASTDNGAEIIQFDSAGDGSQAWSLEEVSPGIVKIRNIHSGKVIDVPGGSPQPGVHLIQFGDNGGNNQLWRVGQLADVPNARFFTNVATGLAMDVEGRSQNNGANIIQFPTGFDNKVPQNQQWLLSS